MKAFGCDQRVERELLWAIKPKKKMYVSTVYTVVKTWRSSRTRITLHAQSICNNDLHHTIRSSHTQGLLSIIYHRPPPSLSYD